MKRAGLFTLTIAAVLGVSGCGQSASGCGNVDLTTEYRFWHDDTLATIKNNSNDPKIVTLLMIDEDGREVDDRPINVGAKGFATEEFRQPRDEERYKVKLGSCK